jgi:hypothetical protein
MRRVMASVTIDLAAAGLTHAPGKSDRCDKADGHDIDWLAITSWDNPELREVAEVSAALQALHEQAHPHGAAYWQNCREPGCADLCNRTTD